MKQKQSREKIDKVTDMLTTFELLGIKNESFNRMLDELPVNLWIHDENHVIVYGNRCFKENFGVSQKQTCHQCLMGEKNVCSCCPSRGTLEKEKPARCKLCKRGKCGYDLDVSHTVITHKDGREYVLTSSLYTKDFGVLAEKENLNGEKKLLVMCASCKKIKDKNNNWVMVDQHILNYFKVPISHGICLECAGILYPMLDIQEQDVNGIAK